MDPSMRNWGIAKATLDIETNDLYVHGLYVISPVKDTNKKTKQNKKDVDRAVSLYAHSIGFLKDSQLSFVEVPHGSQGARAMASYGICCGVLGALSCHTHPPIQVGAFDVKHVVAGSREADKKEVIQWAMDKHPEAPWPMLTRKGVTSVNESKAEHMADAIAAIYAGMHTPQYKQFKETLLGKLCEST